MCYFHYFYQAQIGYITHQVITIESISTTIFLVIRKVYLIYDTFMALSMNMFEAHMHASYIQVLFGLCGLVKIQSLFIYFRFIDSFTCKLT